MEALFTRNGSPSVALCFVRDCITVCTEEDGFLFCCCHGEQRHLNTIAIVYVPTGSVVLYIQYVRVRGQKHARRSNSCFEGLNHNLYKKKGD